MKTDLVKQAIRKRKRAKQLERLARTWADPKHLPFVDFRRCRRKVRELTTAAREQRAGAQVLEAQAGRPKSRE